MNVYSIEDIVRKLQEHNVYVKPAVRERAGSDKLRPERYLSDGSSIRSPQKYDYYEFRLTDDLYYSVLSNPNLRVLREPEFPLNEFLKPDGKGIFQYHEMPLKMQKRFDEVYAPVERIKNYKESHKADAAQKRENRLVICVRYGAIEKSDLRKQRNLVLVFHEADVDVIIDLIFEMLGQ